MRVMVIVKATKEAEPYQEGFAAAAMYSSRWRRGGVIMAPFHKRVVRAARVSSGSVGARGSDRARGSRG
jgi:hypothetical protein